MDSVSGIRISNNLAHHIKSVRGPYLFPCSLICNQDRSNPFYIVIEPDAGAYNACKTFLQPVVLNNHHFIKRLNFAAVKGTSRYVVALAESNYSAEYADTYDKSTDKNSGNG